MIPKKRLNGVEPFGTLWLRRFLALGFSPQSGRMVGNLCFKDVIMSKVIIGNNNSDYVLTYENALLCYVYGRVNLNTNWFLFLLPSVFYLFHHAIEVSIKTLLELKNIKYPHGQDGHRTLLLLNSAVSSNFFSKNVNGLLGNQELTELLKAMDDSYLKNKYSYPGYSLIGVRLRELVDEVIFILFEEVNFILKSKKHALAVLHVPEPVERMFLHKLGKQFHYTVLELREY
jgi:hypothetical protein